VDSGEVTDYGAFPLLRNRVHLREVNWSNSDSRLRNAGGSFSADQGSILVPWTAFLPFLGNAGELGVIQIGNNER
jgi:hypothetical protein